VNLIFPPIDWTARTTALQDDLAVMLVGMTARQATSPTALFNARIATNPYEASLLAPPHGAFNRAAALAMTRWKET
jgi:hypothetical protein